MINNYAKILARGKYFKRLRNVAGRIGSIFLRKAIKVMLTPGGIKTLRDPASLTYVEHERTPGEVAVMCCPAHGMREGSLPSLCQVSSVSSTLPVICHCGASGGRLNQSLAALVEKAGAGSTQTNSLTYGVCL